eukprot:7680226-Karenia_brevis.AAC.1
MTQDRQAVTSQEVLAMVINVSKAWSWQQVVAEVPHCRVTRMFNQEEKKVEMAIPKSVTMEKAWVPSEEKDVTISFVGVLVQRRLAMQTGYKLLQGSAPAGDLERKLQTWLDQNA